jgi:hypothetical protein
MFIWFDIRLKLRNRVWVTVMNSLSLGLPSPKDFRVDTSLKQKKMSFPLVLRKQLDTDCYYWNGGCRGVLKTKRFVDKL